MENEARYFQVHCQKRVDFEVEVKKWIDNVMRDPKPEDEFVINPQDSVNNAGSRGSRTGANLAQLT